MEFRGETKAALENMIRLNMPVSRCTDFVKDQLGCSCSYTKAAYAFGMFRVKFFEVETNAVPKGDYKFGDWVTFENGLTRRLMGGREGNNPYLYWSINRIVGEGENKGIFLGYRRLQNGVYIPRESEDGGSFIDTKRSTYIRAALICRGPRNKPQRVSVIGLHKLEKHNGTHA
jgi:hypothetical protein